MIQTLKRTVYRLTDWSKKSDFNTVYLEQSFGGYDGWPSIDVALGNNRFLKLRGQIDRVDEYMYDGQLMGLLSIINQAVQGYRDKRCTMVSSYSS